MKINKDLTMFRCKLNQINTETSMKPLFVQRAILDKALQHDVIDNVFAHIKKELDSAMQCDEKYLGFTDEVDMLVSKEMIRNQSTPSHLQVRGHDYLKLWFKTFFMVNGDANFIIADAATHHILQNVLSHTEKAELLRMMRGYKKDLVAQG